MPGKKPTRPSAGRRARKYRKPSLVKHGPLDSDVAAFSALY
jgi:hypothetical protein